MKTILRNRIHTHFFIFILFFLFICFLPKSLAQGSTVGLVGHWAMEEDNAVTPLTDSASTNNGAVTAGSLVSQIGKRGYALFFDGANDIVVVADDASLNMTTAITLAAWIKPSQQTTQRIIIKLLGTDGYELFLASGGMVSFRINNTTRLNSTTSYPIDGNTWMHVAATYDGTNMKLYINGTQEGGDKASGNIRTNSVNLGIGSELGGSKKFEGSIDDARIYNRALSFSEIQELLTFWAPPSVAIVNNGAGNALNFNGTDGYVTVPDANSLDITGNITLEAWIKPSKTGTQRIIRKVNASLNQGYSLFLASSGYFSIKFNDDNSLSTGRVNTSEHYNSPLNEWIHIAATYDGSTIRTYFNGVPDNTLATSFTILANTEDLSIGATSFGNGPFEGVMDEVRVWNVARTESQIQDNMCKKLSGSESGLVAYWQFGETSRSFVQDETSNENDGFLTESAGDHVWSGAAVGDVSANDYSGASASDFTASVPFSTESITATGSGGTFSGIQVYRVDDNSVRSGSTVPVGYTADPLRNWGVKVIGSSTPTYDLVYNYTGHPGIITEADLRLVKRSDLSDADWLDAGATLDVDAKTLTVAGETGTQFALASTSDALPVELASFSAILKDNAVQLNWMTATEVNNYGFNVERKRESENWNTLGFVEGHGNTNSPKKYSFLDNDIVAAGIYYYRLKQIDNDGSYEFSQIIEIDFNSPISFELKQNYPNPFNPSTTITFTLPANEIVSLSVYNMLGEEIQILQNGFLQAGIYSYNFNAEELPSGVYIYNLSYNNKTQTKKMLLLK